MSKELPIISCVRDDGPPQVRDFSVDPAFCLSVRQPLYKKPKGVDSERYYQYLTQMIQRNPQDLSLHVRRISLAVKLKDKKRTPAALLDLYWILGNRGKELRVRMLHHAKNWLSNEQLSGFRSAEQRDIRPEETWTHLPGSTMSTGQTGRFDFLLPQNANDVVDCNNTDSFLRLLKLSQLENFNG